MHKVLIVDDEPLVRRLMRELFEDSGCELIEAANAAAGRAEAARTVPDVVLVDKNLPDGSGLDLIRALKADDPTLEIILITGYATLDSAIAAIEVGAFDYLVKPFPELQTVLLKVRSAADKTRLARLEAQHRHAQKMEALGRLAGGVAHDFNNMLSVMLACTHEALLDLKTNATGPHTEQALEDILVAVDSATRLTRQLLAFARRPVGRREALDVNGLITELRSMLVRVLGAEIELELALDPAIGAVMMARTHFEQLLTNLVVNARDAIDRRGTVTIATEVKDGQVVIAVRDTGGGMTPDVVARIFEPFFTTKAAGRGTGLGLAMVSAIVEEAGGTIRVDSQVGSGTTFRMTLPAVVREAVAPRANDASATLPRARGERVLIVEDDEQLRDVLARMFQRTGYRVAVARDGQDAMQRFAEANGQIDLLVTDVVMPKRSGDELAALLMRERPSLKTLYISGHMDHVEGGGEVLVKPFGERELAGAVRGLLRREPGAS